VGATFAPKFGWAVGPRRKFCGGRDVGSEFRGGGTRRQNRGMADSCDDSNDATPWWREAVVYQIYPRSFADSNGDGIGDLAGITSKLDYLADLGVDALWLSPIFTSPMRDFGYDVADYCGIDPVFGTDADFDDLITGLHDRGMRLLLDWVPNHTSSDHPWFVESRSSRDNPKRDWYVWRDRKPDGSPPTNWMSQFKGVPAWTHDDTTDQSYLHVFLSEQPDLNWANPDVEAAMLDTLRYWLDRGVDGFRSDVVNLIGKGTDVEDLPEHLVTMPLLATDDPSATNCCDGSGRCSTATTTTR
jgi:alpha-glucosidase